MKIHTFGFLHAAHRLPKHKGKCKNLHGHSFMYYVEAESEKLKDGMIFDFGIIREKLDHKNLNDIIKNPTAENLIQYIHKIIMKQNSSISYLKIRVWEDITSFIDPQKLIKPEGEYVEGVWYGKTKKKR